MTLYDDLLNAGLPVIDAEEGTTPHFSRILTLDEEDIRDSIMNKPVYDAKMAKKDIAEQFQNRIDRLTQIATVAKPETFTQADIGAMFDAIQDMARNQRAIIKRIK